MATELVDERASWLNFGSDIGLRNRWFTRGSFAHPAKLHLGFLQWLLVRYTSPGDTIVDPMAGIGSTLLAAIIQRNVIVREVEPRWLEHCRQNAASILRGAGMFAGSIGVGQADAREAWYVKADHVIFSPPYGCDFTATSPLSRRGYVAASVAKAVNDGALSWQQAWDKKIGLAQQFMYGQHPSQIGHFRDERYWAAMGQIYRRSYEALRSNGYMILVIKDHIRDRQRATVVDDTIQLCEQLGFRLHARHKRLVHPLSLWQRRRKERGEPVVEDEDALVFTKAGTE